MFGVLIALSLAQTPPSISAALLGPSGEAVLLQPDGFDAKPERFVKAFCGAQSTTVKFKSTRPDTDDAPNNWTQQNFEKLPGSIFTLGAKVTVNEGAPYCVLMTEAAARDVTAVAVKNDTKDCDADTRTKLGKVSKEKLTRCVQVATFDGGSLYFLDSARKKNVKPTVRFVAIAAETVIVKEIKASSSEPPSCWRVDDSCEFEPGSYQPTSVLKQGTEFGVVILWAGAEGNNVLIDQSKGSKFKELNIGSFYNSP
ncbi:MAG: hypothetical protein ACO1OB_31325 [Archangium sp.]